MSLWNVYWWYTLVMSLIGLGISINEHGDEHTGKKNVWTGLIGFLLFTLPFLIKTYGGN